MKTMARHKQRPLGTLRDGTPLTEDTADELADEAERGYDLSRGRRVGRKSLAGGSGHSPRINLRMTRELHDRAQARARQEGKTLSQLAREALERYVK
jgi:predicted HicB family RNase H-like nuclease